MFLQVHAAVERAAPCSRDYGPVGCDAQAVAICCRLAADASKVKEQSGTARDGGNGSTNVMGGGSREQSPALDTLLPGYLSRPNPSPAKVSLWLQFLESEFTQDGRNGMYSAKAQLCNTRRDDAYNRRPCLGFYCRLLATLRNCYRQTHSDYERQSPVALHLQVKSAPLPDVGDDTPATNGRSKSLPDAPANRAVSAPAPLLADASPAEPQEDASMAEGAHQRTTLSPWFTAAMGNLRNRLCSCATPAVFVKLRGTLRRAAHTIEAGPLAIRSHVARVTARVSIS